MVQFDRQPSGLYLSTDPADARVAFLFQDPSRTDPNIQLTAQNWTQLSSLGFFAFFVPSGTRDWNAFATGLRNAFAGTAGAGLGWFPEPLGGANAPILAILSGQGSAPVLEQSIPLQFRNSVSLSVQPDAFGAGSFLFDDATNSFQAAGLQSIQLTLTPPSGGGSTSYNSSATTLSLPMTGALAGTVGAPFQLDMNALAIVEAGVTYFNPPKNGGLVEALSYPVVRGPGGATNPFGFNVSLDVLAPLDPARSFFQFTDPLLGSYFVTSTGKPMGFRTVGGPNGAMSRLVFAGRPVTGPNDASYYYLTPAGRFGLMMDEGTGARAVAADATTGPEPWMLCGVTGTEFLRVGSSGISGVVEVDALEFVPGNAAYRVPEQGSNDSAHLDGTATTAWARFHTQQGAYVSQPERSPLFSQPGTSHALMAGAPPASGLTVYVLDFNAVDTWRPAPPKGPAVAEAVPDGSPAFPLAPYAGLDFATNPDPGLVGRYLEMESRALNPTRADAFVTARAAKAPFASAAVDASSTLAMTPQGMLATLTGDPPVWSALEMAVSGAGPLQFKDMGPSICRAVQQNQIFVVISAPPDTKDPLDPTHGLFTFADSSLEIGDWTFDLSPAGGSTTDKPPVPPIFMMKFYPGQPIEALVQDTRLWSQPDTFNTTFSADQAQAYVTKLIEDARAAVFPNGGDQPDTDSLYYNFYQTVTDPAFSGILAVNCNIELQKLPTAIKAVLGGMKDPGVAGFRAHHVGIAINDTDPSQPTPALAKSAMFALVDYEKATDDKPAAVAGIEIDYGFEVEYLRALFMNSELRSFACKINLTVNNLFDTNVTLQSDKKATAGDDGNGDDGNIIAIMGSYQAHATSGDDSSSGQGVYSFVAQGTFEFDFKDNNYLQSITLTKLQFSFDQETPATTSDVSDKSSTSHISAHFGIWGSMVFKNLEVLDIFSFEQLVFSDLGIDVGFDLTTYANPPKPPTTDNLSLSFAPGDLRLDLGSTTTRPGGNSLLKLIPFKLKSFLYSQKADQTVEDLNYYSLGSLPLPKGITLQDRFNYALLFDLDLGSMGGLVGSLSAFKFSILIGWLSPGDSSNPGGLAFGVQMPEADGKLEIKIQGVLTISIAQFNLVYATENDPKMIVLGMKDCFIEILGNRLPPSGTISIGLFAPTEGADQIGWIAAYNNGEDGGGGEGEDGENGGKDGGREVAKIAAKAGGGNGNGNGGNGGDSKVLEMTYLGVGQRVGPDPASPPTDFDSFLSYMQEDFWTALKDKKYSEIYHPDGKWIIITDFTLLGVLELGFVFYDVTPFYSLLLRIKSGAGKGAEFEITYTKVSDTIGLFAAKFGLPDSLRTFQVGAASVTLPVLLVDVYTNGNWKVDLGFPDGDDWSVCFQVQAMAGPIPVTGAGGFYIASLSSATAPDVFKGTYQSILEFGFAARLGVGKDFTSGPLKAGVSVTFFGIVQGAAGYLTSGGGDIFKQPDALCLKGQFGIIGEIYGSIDFVIIKASVNVRLEASIGIVLTFEPSQGNNGSILLYIDASVRVSVTVSIDLGLFSIDISFSFRASFHFEWQLVGSSNEKAFLLTQTRTVRAVEAVRPLPLCPGLTAALPILALREVTVVFPNGTATGVPWLVTSLGVEYDNAPPASPTYAQFKPFEAVATQLATFALLNALGLSVYNSAVTLDQLKEIDSPPPEGPNPLTDWIDYPTLLGQLANFQGTVAVPGQGQPAPKQPVQLYASAFPMLPFLNLATKGRPGGDLAYQFLSKNAVPQSYIATVDAYFNQTFVNQTPNGAMQAMLAAPADVTTPLIQEIFLDYFKGLIRGAVHELLVTLQQSGETSSALDKLFIGAVGAQRFMALAGQMSSAARGGVRLPYLSGLTLPDGTTPKANDPVALYALLWQEFPASDVASTSYTVTLTNPDSGQGWLSANTSFTVDQTLVGPYAGLTEGSVTKPGNPTPILPTRTGPQAFAFENAIVWTAPKGTLSLRPFPPSLATLQRSWVEPISVLVQSRPTNGSYAAGGTPLPLADITFATTINLTVRTIPGATPSKPLPDVYALSGASQADEALLGQVLAALAQDNQLIDNIQILYQTAAGAPGLTSKTVTLTDVFVLRTNTTTVSQPPSLMMMAAQVPTGVSVGADLDLTADGGYGFVQIVQQATVTNAPGYYLRYIEPDKSSLPAALVASGVAPLTLVISYKPGTGQNQPGSPLAIQPYYNSIALAGTQAGQVYYAETAAPELETRYVSLAAGTFGVELTRGDEAMYLKATPALAAQAGVAGQSPRLRSHVKQALHAAGVTDPEEMRRLLAEAQDTPAQLNALYSVVAYQIQGVGGFNASNLSAPMQPQKQDPSDTTGTYRVVAALYNVAKANQGLPTPNRYADIHEPFALSIFVSDAFGNQLPTAVSYPGTNWYFDPILPLDQWPGIVPTFDFAGPGGPKPNQLHINLAPSQDAFAGMSADRRQAVLATCRTIQDQITGVGVSFYVETSLALQADGVRLVPIPLGQSDTQAVTGMIGGLVSWLADSSKPFPGPVDILLPVSGPGTLPPLFEIAVLFGIERDPTYISPLLKDQFGTVIFPSAQNVATTLAAATGGASQIGVFAAAFTTAFPAMKLAVGMNGAAGASQSNQPRHLSSTTLARKRLRALGLAGDGTGGTRSGQQSIWAAAAVLLDITIGAGAQAGPRFLSPKPLDNALNSALVPLPTLDPKLPALPSQQQFVDVDLDQLNRIFFQAVDSALAPAAAAQTFELDPTHAAYQTIANGRASLAQEYADFEVDWLFGPQSPFTGTTAQLKTAREVFGQQMRAALMTAYAVDTIVQYDVAWKGAVPATADGLIELFGQVEATLSGTYDCSGKTVNATTAAPHGLATGDSLLMVFAPGSTAPANGVYQVAVSGPKTFTVTVTAGSGSGSGTFTATRQNAGLSTAHVGVSSTGPSPLTFLYGNPDVASTALATFDLRFNVTNLQYFLAPDTGQSDLARPSIWLQLVNPYPQGMPHIGPDGTLTTIPAVFRQYPTPPTLISQSWATFTPKNPGSNPIADGAEWSYLYTYQGMLADQDQINSAITYNTDLSAASNPSNNSLAAAAGDGGPYDLFTALARFSAVYNAVTQTQAILQNPTDPRWGAAVTALSNSVAEVVANTDWNPTMAFAMGQGLVKVTDNYVITDKLQGDETTRLITLSWDPSQGQSSFAGVTLSLQALKPTDLTPYPNQSPVSPPPSHAIEYKVDDAAPGGLGVVHRIEVDGLNVLAAENALAAVQIERNLITLEASDDTSWTPQREFIYMTPLVRPSQPLTPYIDNPAIIDVTTLPNQGAGAACPTSPASLCQRIYTVMAALLTDPVQHPSLLAAHEAAGVTAGTERRVKVTCSYQFPVVAVAGGTIDDKSIRPLAPSKLARSFEIDGSQPDQIGDFAVLFAEAVTSWASANGIVFGPNATPPGAALVFDITLYAGLSGVNTPVLRFSNLELKLTDIDAAGS
jgi:hypothetical protein